MSAGAIVAGLMALTLVAVRGAVRAGARARSTRGLSAGASSARVGRVARPAPAWFADRMAAVDLGVCPDRLWRIWLTTSVVAPLFLWLTAGPALAALGLAAVVAAPPIAWRANRGRADARLQAALPDALESIARALRSGAALRTAVAEAGAATPGPLGADLLGAARAAEARGIVAALEAWGGARPLPGVRLAVAALCLGAETGGAQARAIDGVAATLRQRLAAAAEARALASQARASAVVIALAPIAFCGLTSATDPRVGAFLFRSGGGIAVLAAGLVLDTAGVVWMARLTRPAL